MTQLFRRIRAFHFPPFTFPLFLLALCLIAYTPLITRMGFYWDDFPMNWIATTMGRAGLARYFSTNRPVWGLVYQVTTTLLGSKPLTWQIFAIGMRWVTGLALWALLRLVWVSGSALRSDQQRSAREQFAGWAAAIFVIYPGFSQQYNAFLYSHFYIILTVFLLSLALMALALRLEGAAARRWYLPLTLASLLLGLLNLLAMEYFFLLDLLRPLFIWVILSERLPDRRKRLQRTLLTWLPYLALFAGAMYWRSVLFGFQTYQPALMSRIKANPLQAIWQLIPIVFEDVATASIGAWVKDFRVPTLLEVGKVNLQRYWLLVAASGLAALAYLLFYHPAQAKGSTSAVEKVTWRTAWQTNQLWAWQPLALGVISLFIAGGPFWLTDLKILLVSPNDRFTLPFMMGVSLATAGLLLLLPLPRWSKSILLALGLGFAVGLQFQSAVVYTRDWSVQRSMFWQLTWRMPALEPGTALLSNELPLVHYTDNSLTAPLNWTFDPQNDPANMRYALFYPTLRKEDTLSNLKKDQPINLNYLATTFQGSTSQMVAFYYSPPGCVRVLDPEIDIYNWTIPLYLRESLTLTTTKPILAQPEDGEAAPRPPAQVFGTEISRGWCYYFEKADLARQLGDWQTVTSLGDQAFAGSDYPNDPLERFTFIEGYAHTGNWSRALELTQVSQTISPEMMQPMLCKLWERIGRETQATEAQQNAVKTVQAGLECTPGAGQQAK